MQDLMEFAVDVARQAGAVTLEHFRAADLTVDHKADRSPVTAADTHAETLMRRLITERYPEDAVVGEEHVDTEGFSGRTWYLDPIDGTKSFVHGVPLFTNLVACHDPDGPLIGVINTPALDQTTWAGRDQGCFLDGSPAQVSDVDTLERAYVMTSSLGGWPAPLRPRLLDAPFTWRTWGDGYGYSLVATGQVEAMVDPVAAVWDLAPMPVIITEAGGRFTNLDTSRPSDGGDAIDGGSAIASNSLVHEALAAYLTPSG